MTENEKMRFYREAMGWSRKQLSQLIGFNEVYINKIESAQRPVSGKYRARMAEVLETHRSAVCERLEALNEVLHMQHIFS